MKDKLRRVYPISIVVFLILETVMYGLIMTQRGQLQVTVSYLSILCCLACLLVNFRRCDKYFLGAMTCTAAADFFLVLCTSRFRVWGMVFFLAAQILYACCLHRRMGSSPLLLLRVLLTVIALGITVAVLRDKTDALALVSLAYYANLIVNLIMACMLWRKDKLLPVAFVLFLLCDTVIGLQIGAGAYLPITEGSFLHTVLFVDFPLAWFFYLPSQVMLAVCGVAGGKNSELRRNDRDKILCDKRRTAP